LSAERGVRGDEHPRHAATAELALEDEAGAKSGLKLVAELVGHAGGRMYDRGDTP
jgi:hypothetical protein